MSVRHENDEMYLPGKYSSIGDLGTVPFCRYVPVPYSYTPLFGMI